MRYDWVKEGVLYVIRQKTYRKTETAYIAIQLSERLQGVVESSKGIRPLIVHRRSRRTNKDTKHSD